LFDPTSLLFLLLFYLVFYRRPGLTRQKKYRTKARKMATGYSKGEQKKRG